MVHDVRGRRREWLAACWRHPDTLRFAAILANLPGVTFWVTFAAGLRLTSVEGLIQRAGLAVVLLWMFHVAVTVQGVTANPSSG